MYSKIIYTRKSRRKTSRIIADAKIAIRILQNRSFEEDIVSTWGFKCIDDWVSCVSLKVVSVRRLNSFPVTLFVFSAKLVSGEGVSSTYLKLYKFKLWIHQSNTKYIVKNNGMYLQSYCIQHILFLFRNRFLCCIFG